MILFHRKKAISAVISSIILSASVLVIGGAIWGYAKGSSDVLADSYISDTRELIFDITERFTVEHVTNNSDCSIISVWVYNYGSVDVLVDVYVIIDSATYSSDLSLPIIVHEGERERVDIEVVANKGDSVGIEIYSRRQNIAYYTYLID